MTTTQNIETAIVGLFERIPSGVSFADVEEEIEAAGINPRGDFGFSATPLMKLGIYLWLGMSEDFMAAFRNLANAEIIVARDTSALIYRMDGRVPAFPEAKTVRAYDEPHWAPAVLSRGPNWDKRAEVSR